MDEVKDHRQLSVRALRQLIAGETNCTSESAQVLRTLSVIADQLEAGRLHTLHSCLMVARRKIRGVPTHTVARERHKVLRKKMIDLLRSIDLTIGDHELIELAYVLPIATHVLGLPAARTTILPDGSRGTFRELLHRLIEVGVKETTRTSEHERVLVAT